MVMSKKKIISIEINLEKKISLPTPLAATIRRSEIHNIEGYRYDSFQINRGYGWVRFIQIGIFFSALLWNQCERYFPVCVGVLDFPDNSILVLDSDNRSVESKNFHRWIFYFIRIYDRIRVSPPVEREL